MRLKNNNQGSAVTFLLIALALVGVPSYLFTHGWPKPLLLYLGKPIGQLRVRGPVERRHAYSPAFLAVKDGDPVYTGDVIYTGPSAEALVKLNDGRALEVMPSTLVKLVRVDPNAVDSNVYLGRMRAGGDRAFSLRVTDVRGLEAPLLDLFKYLSGSKYALAGAARTTDFSALYAQMTEPPPPTATAPPEETPREVAAITPRRRPRLRFLSPSSERLSIRKNRRTKLRWEKVLSGVTYVVEVAPTQEFENKIEELTKKTSTSIRLHKAGTYYVRVRTVIRGRWVSTPVKVFTVTN